MDPVHAALVTSAASIFLQFVAFDEHIYFLFHVVECVISTVARTFFGVLEKPSPTCGHKDSLLCVI